MAPVFIFAEQVRQLVRSGQKEFEIPEGARISSAAADLIREHGIRVKTVASGKSICAPSPEEKSAAPAPDSRKEPETPEKPAGGDAAGAADGFTEAQLDEIVERVIRRFRRLKGEATAAAAKTAADTDGQIREPDDDLVICRCEEITKGEIREAIRNGMHTLNGIKRITRAGMGLCQGQTCQTLVARILTEELGLAPGEIDPTTARGPVRPIRLQVFANSCQSATTQEDQ